MLGNASKTNNCKAASMQRLPLQHSLCLSVIYHIAGNIEEIKFLWISKNFVAKIFAESFVHFPLYIVWYSLHSCMHAVRS